MNHWTEYRWDEEILCLTNHPDYTELMLLDMPVVSVRFADFYWAMHH